MIVRNEAAVIERCLESVSGLVDSWVVCDTGSTDGTQEIVRAALAHLPGELHQTPWIDFGHNRTELMQRARGSADYLLLLDADMTVRRQEQLPLLDADAYLVREVGALDYAVVRLVRGDREWWFEGSTHEHIATNGLFDQRELDALSIEHHADGSARSDKLLRDVALLKRDIARNPDNPRPVFYLAQTLRALGKREPAIEYYRRRLELGGWDEEVFYANLMEGVLVGEEDVDAATSILLRAWERRPTRAEPLYELARLHRLRGDFSIARLFARCGLELAYPSDVLFVHRSVHDWGLRLEAALATAGAGDVETARSQLRDLLPSESLPARHQQEVGRLLADLSALDGAARAERVERFSASAIAATPARVAAPLAGAQAPRHGPGGSRADRLGALAPSLRIGEITIDVQPRWPAFNPSIAADEGGGFVMVVRTANYQIGGGVFDDDGVLQNINYLVSLDADLAVTSIEPVVDETPVQRFPSSIKGYEDCRLIEIAGTLFAAATVCDLNPIERREMALLSLEGGRITGVNALQSPYPGRHEKNWMPFETDSQLHFVYSCAPTVILKAIPGSGRVSILVEQAAPPAARGFRGGSQGVPVEDGHLFVVHEIDRSGRSLAYLHRFLLLDANLAVAGFSRPFSFTSDRVEFCAGIARRNDELVLSFGVSDAAAGLAIVPLHEVLDLVEPAPGRVYTDSGIV